MCYIPDAYDMWCEHDGDCEERLAMKPKCECCREHIQTDRAFHYNDMWFCKDCEEDLRDMVWNDIKKDYLCEV